MSNINPDMKPYKKMSPLKFFALTNFPFIDEDFDALTNYELMCKIVEYLNGVINNTNIANENVDTLYNAFLSLQESVNDALAEQDAKIEDYFNDINIQNFVDNKIDAMIEDNEFQEILIQAVNEVSPDIMNLGKRINVITDFDTYFINNSPYTANSTNILNTNNKAILINLFNYMIKNHLSHYYFINPYDGNHVVYFELNTDSIGSNIVGFNGIMNTSVLNLEYGDSYFHNISFTPTIVDGLITDLTYLSTSNNSYNVLRTNNDNAFEPVGDYQPATKKYVDDNAGGSGGTVPIYEYNPASADTWIAFNEYGSLNFDTAEDTADFIAILNDAREKGLVNFIILFKNPTFSQIPTICLVSYQNANWSASLFTTIDVGTLYDSVTYGTSLIVNSNNAGANIARFGIDVVLADGVITSLGSTNRYYNNNATYMRADDITRKSYNVTLESAWSNSPTDPVTFLVQGKQVNIKGTIVADALALWSNSKVTIPYSQAPNSGVAGSTISTCYNTAILYKAATGTYEYVYSNIIITQSTGIAHISFAPIDASVTIAAGDTIRFNISYITEN